MPRPIESRGENEISVRTRHSARAPGTASLIVVVTTPVEAVPPAEPVEQVHPEAEQ